MSPVVAPIVVAVVFAVVVLVIGGRAILLGGSSDFFAAFRRHPEPGERRVGLLASARQELNEAAGADAGLDEMLAWSDPGTEYLDLGAGRRGKAHSQQ